MATTTDLESFLNEATIDEEVFALRPDYRALLIAVDGIEPGASDAHSEALLVRAEAVAASSLAQGPVEELPHIAAWREAYRAFGAKPQRTRNSLEALTRRAVDGLPRVNRLTDIYNAISVTHQIPLGGEDLGGYESAPRLTRASGSENFDTISGGEITIEHPDRGEVIWGDVRGVTCRRWNWRQGRRTALTDNTRSALFILDALAPLSDEDLTRAGQELVDELSRLGEEITVSQRLLAAGTN